MIMGKIYTRAGDGGNTSLWDGTPVSKGDLHIETNGVLDELSSAIGLARSLAPAAIKKELERLQELIFLLMAYVARGKKVQPTPDPGVLEAWIDELSSEYPTERGFVYSGESPSGGALHLARTIARRAERVALPLFETGGTMEPAAYQYINRLSDLLFALARKADVETQVARITEEVMRDTITVTEQLNLKKTIRLMEVARSKAADIGKAFVIAICDASGDLLSLERMDGALLVSIALAQNKARSAVRIQLDTKDIAPLAQPGASLYGIQNGVEPMCSCGGGRLLRHKGQIVGGVGVSGGSVEEDLSVADAVVDFFETTI